MRSWLQSEAVELAPRFYLAAADFSVGYESRHSLTYKMVLLPDGLVENADHLTF